MPFGSQATIRYQDVADQTIALGQFALYDLTGDGSNDIALTVNFAGNTFIALSTPTIGNIGSSSVQVLGTSINVSKLPTAFSVGPASGTYTTSQTGSCTVCIQNAGDWVGGSTDAYIGFRFTKIGTNTVHYGWVRVAVNNIVSNITIKEIAYETTANTALNTGFIPLNSLQIQGAGGVNTIAIDDATLQMEAIIAPLNATVQSYTWTSDNPTVATIDANGLVTAYVDGNTLIRAVSQDGTNLFDTARIYVSNQIVPVGSIVVSSQSGTANISSLRGTLQMQAAVLPTFATNQNVVWSVDDETLATIDNNGLLRARRNGTVVVVATAIDGSRVSGSMEVLISGQPLLIESISLQGGVSISSPFGQLQFTTTTQPTNPNNPAIIWSVSNNSIAGISPSGLLQAYKNGQITVRAEAADGGGAVATMVVTISNQLVAASAIQVIGQGGLNNISSQGGQLQMQTIFTPANATNTHVFWAVDNPQIATITHDGRLKAIRNGSVQVSALAQDGSAVIGQTNITVTNQYELLSQLQIAGAGGATAISTPYGQLQILPTFTPISATNQNLIWTVSNNNIAYIDSTGLLSARGNGNITVTAISQDGSGLTATMLVSLSNQPVLTNTLALNAAGGASGIYTALGTLQINPTFSPANTTNQDLVWTVDNPNFAVVDENGLVTALRNGTVTITATTQDGTGLIESISLVIANQPIPLNTLQIRASSFNISSSRDTLQLSTLYNPTNATNTTVTWYSSHPQIATVSNAGILSAVADGTVTITALAQDGSAAFASQVFTISNQPIYTTAIAINSSTSVYTISSPSATLQMLAAITPANATNNTVSWQVDSPQIASINPQGLLLAHNNGLVRVTATAQDGSGISVSRFITVTNQPALIQSINISARSAQLVGSSDTLQMNLTYLPVNATNPNFIWRSSDLQKAMVSPIGLVTPRADGVVTISAHAYDGSAAFADYIITITNQNVFTSGLSINIVSGTNPINTHGSFLQLQAVFTPSTTTFQNVAWSVSDASIATINAQGRLYALANGSVVVTATAQDGSQVSANLSVVVTNQQTLAQAISIFGQAGQTSINSPSTTLQMQANFMPAATSNQNLVWQVDNPIIAQISQTGLLLAKANGTVQVSAYTQDGSGLVATTTINITNQYLPIQTITVTEQSNQTAINTAGGSLQMLAAFAPAVGTVIWSVDNPAIATISAQGELTAVADGVVTVIATAADNAAAVGQMTITISNQPIWISTISVAGQGGQTSISTNNGSLQMIATINPVNATNPNVVWRTAGGTGWATINPSTGLLTAAKDGTVIVRATAQENPLIFDEITIIITGQPTGGPNIANINLSAPTNTISIDNAPLQIQYNHNPPNSNGAFTYAINPNNLATIDNAGLLQPLDNGVITVTATSLVNAVTDDYVVTITNQYTALTNLSIQGQGGQTAINTIDGSLQMQVASFLPTNATNTALIWAIDNNNIATIDQTGLLRAYRNGNILVTAYAQDGSGLLATATISLSNQFIAIDSIQIQPAINNISTANGILSLSALVYPTTATAQNVAWLVDNNSIASIDKNGVLQAHTNGTVQVVARAQDSSQKADTILVTITNQPTLATALSISSPTNPINTAFSTLTMQATFSPVTTTNTNLVWRVDNPALARINQQGELTALANGLVQVRATTQDGSGVSATYNLSISQQAVYINALQIQGASSATNINAPYGTLQMQLLSIAPSAATFPNLAWSVASPALATISPTGLLRAKANGTVTVLARTQDGSRILATATITISNQPLLIQGISFTTNTRLITTAGGAAQFAATVSPTNATNQNLQWRVADPALGNINKYNMYTAVRNGLNYIYAYAQGGSTIVSIDSVVSINQYTNPTSLAVQGQSGQTIISNQSGTLQMEATAQPTPSPTLTYTWSVSPAGDATISTSGLLVARQNSVVTVTAIAQDGSNAIGETTITITNQPVRINSLLISTASGAAVITTAQGSLQMLATLSPANATYTNIAWSVNNTNLATIGTNGVLRARQNGIISITARSLDGTNITSSFSVTISNQNIPTTTLSISGQASINSITTSLGSLVMQPIFNPAAPTNTQLYWQSSDNNIATIDYNGIVHARRNGTVIITATTLDGAFISATRSITISNQPTFAAGLSLSTSGGSSISTPFGVLDILPSLTPAVVTNNSVYFWVNAPHIANINATGQIRARQNGTLKVYAVALDLGQVIDSISITISNQPIITNTLQISTPNNIDSIALLNGTLQFSYLQTPSTPTNPNLYWSVDNPSIATVSQSGLLQAVGNGTVLVSLSAQDGSGQTGALLVRVLNQTNTGAVLVSDIDVFASATQITTPNGSLAMSANVFPANASNQTLLWSVSDSRRASITAAGLLTARADGNILVFATAQDGANVSGIYNVALTNQPIVIVSTNTIITATYAANIYPNPSTNAFNLAVNTANSTKAKAWICDALGRPIFNQELILETGDNLFQFVQLADAPDGIYYLHLLFDDGQVLTKPLHKQGW